GGAEADGGPGVGAGGAGRGLSAARHQRAAGGQDSSRPARIAAAGHGGGRDRRQRRLPGRGRRALSGQQLLGRLRTRRVFMPPSRSRVASSMHRRSKSLHFLEKGGRRCQSTSCSPAAGRGGEFATSGEQLANSPVRLNLCDSGTWASSRGEFASSPLVPGPGGGRARGGCPSAQRTANASFPRRRPPVSQAPSGCIALGPDDLAVTGRPRLEVLGLVGRAPGMTNGHLEPTWRQTEPLAPGRVYNSNYSGRASGRLTPSPP